MVVPISLSIILRACVENPVVRQCSFSLLSSPFVILSAASPRAQSKDLGAGYSHRLGVHA